MPDPNQIPLDNQTVEVVGEAPPSIRNVSQTAQEREIIKTAPDIIVYLDGLPYLINSYLNDPETGRDYVVVNFNDHVQNFNASFDTDQGLVPSGSISLSIPNHQKSLYQAPGGNNIIISMMEVQVFAKGYFLSPRGNTLYHRVFKGLTSHVTHTDNGKTLEISIQIRGILRFMEMMQIDLNPSLMSNSNSNVTVFGSNQWNLDPYQQIADTFKRSIGLEGFQLNTIANQDQKLVHSSWEQAVKADYVAKWQTILNGILADTHIMGYTFGSLDTVDTTNIANWNAAKGSKDPRLLAAAISRSGTLLESDPLRDKYVALIRNYTPDFKVGNITLVNGRIVSRLERIRSIVHHIGFEAYQDINGEIVFKAPLYNLDVTNLTPAPSFTPTNTQSDALNTILSGTNANPTLANPNEGTLAGSLDFIVNNPPAAQKATPPKTYSQADDLKEENNPFVVYLAEIKNESENEDEAAITATRMSIQGNWQQGFQVDSDSQIRAVASHIDIPKLAHFGLREAPAKTLGWIQSNDKILLYTYAANELVRGNRGWRTYSFTIPLRPELRLGFPMYVPHKDLYGYIKSVNINYQIGGAASMGIMLDTIRKRPMFPSERTVPNTTDPKTGQEQKLTIMTSQPNLVMQWTNPDKAATPLPGTLAASVANIVNSPGAAAPTLSKDRASGTGDVPSSDPSVNLLFNPVTLQKPQDEPVYEDQLKMANYRKNQIGSDWQTRTDTKVHSFRVQNDDGFFSKEKWIPNGIDDTYFQKILNTQPYTDEKGYEVVGVFPMGRWKSLPEALKETREGKIVSSVNPQQAQVLTVANATLFAGLYTPHQESSAVLLSMFRNLTNTIETNATFELDWSQPAQGVVLNSQEQPDNRPGSDQALLAIMEGNEQQKIDTLISGTPQPTSSTKEELTITNQNKGQSSSAFGDIIQNFKGLFKP